MGRPDAILDLHAAMARQEERYINTLPPGRRQTKKRRGIVPICSTLAYWLRQWGPGHYVTYLGKPVAEMDTAWRKLRARVWPADMSELPPLESIPSTRERNQERRRRSLLCGPEGMNVNPYSFRHTLGRYLRRSRVPADEISLMLGHILADENDTTGIYSPHDPDYCVKAAIAIDAFCVEVNKLMRGPRRLVIGVPALSTVRRTNEAG